jgi:lon-related putative ATP-dependent protease
MFKINAQFDYETERTDQMITYYSQFVSKICKEENLSQFTPDGVAAVVEWAVDQAGSQKRISLKFSDVADIVREAAFYDRSAKGKVVSRTDVKKAIAWHRHRNDLVDEKLRNYILDGSIMIDTSGKRIGQINGLTVLDTGMLSFGKPARITATISAGSAGIVNIERESDMSGSIHNKGMLIISGFLREKFADKKPMAITASIAFEQNYGGIDGDSASAAEIYVLLSAISKIPIDQSIAITGSVNQKGDIQPIGGVNQKIRGFYEICKERGLTGKQGVIIPKQNVSDLMLCDEVVEDVRKGRFHIYPFSTIEEGVEILMGIPAGKIQKDGTYPSDTLFGKVADRLEEFRKFAKQEKKEMKAFKNNSTKAIKLK